MKTEDNMIKVHLGCGSRDFGYGWINIDAQDLPHVHYKNVTNLEFEDNSVDLIYNSHLLEYFDRQEVTNVLKEWRRVLKPNGILRVAVPDFDKLIYIYGVTGQLNNILGPLYGRIKINNEYRYHKTTYNFTSLKDLLEISGFKNVRRYDWRSTSHFMIDDHSKAHFPHKQKNIDRGYFDNDQILISLNIEASK